MTQYQQAPTSTALYWPNTIIYQPVPPYNDPEPPSSNQNRLILTQYYQVPTSNAWYWPSTTPYQLVPPFSDQVTSYVYHMQMPDFPLSTWDEHSCTLV